MIQQGVVWMIYKDFQGLKISNLGMGCMRLPACDYDLGNLGNIQKIFEEQLKISETMADFRPIL